MLYIDLCHICLLNLLSLPVLLIAFANEAAQQSGPGKLAEDRSAEMMTPWTPGQRHEDTGTSTHFHQPPFIEIRFSNDFHQPDGRVLVHDQPQPPGFSSCSVWVFPKDIRCSHGSRGSHDACQVPPPASTSSTALSFGSAGFSGLEGASTSTRMSLEVSTGIYPLAN